MRPRQRWALGPMVAVGAVLALAGTGVTAPVEGAGVPFLRNGDMSAGAATPDHWALTWSPEGTVVVSRDTVQFHGPPASLRLESTAGRASAWVGQILTAVPSKRVAVRGWVRADAETGQALVALQAYNARGRVIDFHTVADAREAEGWTEFSSVARLPPATTAVVVGVLFTRTRGRLWLDDVTVTEVEAGPDFDPEVEGQVPEESDPVQLGPPRRYQWAAVPSGQASARVLALCTPAKGAPLVSGLAGTVGYRHAAPDRVPPGGPIVVAAAGPGLLDGTGLDVCESDTDFVVVAGRGPGGPGAAGYSPDNGVHWQGFPGRPTATAGGGRVAVSSTNPDVIAWLPEGEGTPLYWTRDRGRTWEPADGTPLGWLPADASGVGQPLCADRTRPGLFYLYDPRDGRLYRSYDGGATWKHRATLPKPARGRLAAYTLTLAPDNTGEVWAALDERGLFRSGIAGAAWVRLSGVDSAQAFGFGRPALANGTPSAYLLGRLRGDDLAAAEVALYRSDDSGTTWSRLSGPADGFAGTRLVAGDRQVEGRVYLGTDSRGALAGTEYRE